MAFAVRHFVAAAALLAAAGKILGIVDLSTGGFI